MTEARRSRRRWLLLAVWLVGALALGEAAIRLAAAFLGRDLGVPGADTGGDVVYCLGDSFTYGQGVAAEEAWPSLLAQHLAAAGIDLRVRTMAEPGRSSSLVTQVAGDRVASGDARLVLVLTGWNANDGDFADHAAARNAPVPWASTVDLWLQHSRLYKLAKHILTFRFRMLVLGGVKVIPQTTAMSLYDFRAYQEIAMANLRTIARLCRDAGVQCAFLTYPHQDLPPNPYTRSEYYHAVFGRAPLTEADYVVHDRSAGEIAIDAVIRTVGREEGIPVIDLQPGFDRAAPGTLLFQDDLHHPTAAGHEIMAQAIFEAIRPLLQPAPR